MMAAIFVMTFVDRSFGPILPFYVASEGTRRRRRWPWCRASCFRRRRAGRRSATTCASGCCGGSAGGRVIRPAVAAAAASGCMVSRPSRTTSPWARRLAALRRRRRRRPTRRPTRWQAAWCPRRRTATGFGFLTGAPHWRAGAEPLVGGAARRGAICVAVFALDLAARCVRCIAVVQPCRRAAAEPS